MTGHLATFAEEIERLLGIRRDPEDEREENRASAARQRTADFQSKNTVHLANVGHIGPQRILRRKSSSGSAVNGMHSQGTMGASAAPSSAGPTSSSGGKSHRFTSGAGSPKSPPRPPDAAVHVFDLVYAAQEEDDALMRARGGSSRSNDVFSTTSSPISPARVAARAAYAAGAQEAVFKVISSTPSKARAGALLQYLGTREGDDGKKRDIAVYTDEGHVLNGAQERKEFLERFSESFEAPLRNTNFIEVQFVLQAPADNTDLRSALNQAFDVKPFVYARYGNTVKAYALTDKKSAAIAKVLANGREKSRSKIVDNLEKGFVDALASSDIAASAQIITAVGDERKAAYFLQNFIRNNRAVKSADGDDIKGGRNSQRAATKLFDAWKRDMVGTNQRRNAFHLLFSAKAGTDPDAVMAAARSVLEEKAHGHKYALAHHADTQHVHVHVMVQAVSNIGERLKFKKADLYEWREAFAEKAREHGIAMVATRRQEHAKPRSYTKEHAGALNRAQQVEGYSVLGSTENRVLNKRSRMLDPQTARRDGSAVAAAWRQTAQIMRQAGVEPRFVANAEGFADDVARYTREHALPLERSVLQRMDLVRHLKAVEGAKSPYVMRRRINAINSAFRKLEASLSAAEKMEFEEYRSSFTQVMSDRLSDLQNKMDRAGLAGPELPSDYLINPEISSSVILMIGKLEMAKTPSEMRTSIERIHATLDDMEATLPVHDKVPFRQYRNDLSVILNDRLKSLDTNTQRRSDDAEGTAVGNVNDKPDQELRTKSQNAERDSAMVPAPAGKDTGTNAKANKHSENIKARRNSERNSDRGR